MVKREHSMGLIDKTKEVVWNIGFIEQEIDTFLRDKSYSICWMKHKYRDRFFADPFLLNEDVKYMYLLAEEYVLGEGKGRIVRLKIDKNNKQLIENKRIIETDYHLSYPYIYGGKIYTEQYRSGKWISYDMNGRPVDVVAEIGLIDATIWDDGIKKWVFASKIVNDKNDANRKLYRYELVDGKIDEKTELQVADRLNASRPGGRFFKVKGQWYRVAQTSTEKKYGESVQICKVLKNTEESYQEEIIMDVHSHNENRFNEGLHTFNVYDKFIIVDGFEMQMHPFQKLLFKIKHR